MAAFTLTDRELATTLAALRKWQTDTREERRAAFYAESDIASEFGIPLTDTEINLLCAKINK